jgi:large subunit ribosomal protein L29
MAHIVELREKSDEEIEEMLENAHEEMFNLRFQHASARLTDLSRLRAVRREVAQLETVLHMRELAIERAAMQPEVAQALEGKEWFAEASYSYEESAWQVNFNDDDDELASALINLNQKKPKSRRGRRQLAK